MFFLCSAKPYDVSLFANLIVFNAKVCFTYGPQSIILLVNTNCVIRGGADKSLARPTSRSRRRESIVSVEIGVCPCAELQVFSC